MTTELEGNTSKSSVIGWVMLDPDVGIRSQPADDCLIRLLPWPTPTVGSIPAHRTGTTRRGVRTSTGPP